MTKDDLLNALQRHIGARNGVHVQRLVLEAGGAPYQERKVRELVADLRMEGHHICATPEDGYFMAEKAEELDRTCVFLYDRAMSTLQQISRMKNIALPDLRGQLKLPT